MEREKDSEARKKEILEAGKTFFINKGYDATSITDILNAVHIAKGTFYYYFSSKEELLLATVEDVVEQGMKKAEKILKDKKLPLEKRICKAMYNMKPQFAGAKAVHKSENAKMEYFYLKTMINRITKLFMEPLEEGMKSGIFNIEYPEECIESIFLLGYSTSYREIFDIDEESYKRKNQILMRNIERLLGTNKGSLKIK